MTENICYNLKRAFFVSKKVIFEIYSIKFSNIFLFGGVLHMRYRFSSVRSLTLIEKKYAFPVFLSMILALSFLLSSCAGGGDRVTEIVSVKYDKEESGLSVSATLDSSDYREFRGETVYLIEIPANGNISEITTLIPVSQSKAGAEMTFSLPMKDGARTMLYSGFVLAVFDRERGYIPLCDAKCIENPEALAQNKSKYPAYSSIKGLSIVSSSEAVAMGTKHTVLRIALEEYLQTDAAEGALSYIFDGTPYYYNADKISELDYKIKALSGAGIEIFLEFSLGASYEELPSSLAMLSSKQTPMREGEEMINNYAISVDDGAGYRYMAAFFEMLAERYTRVDGKYGFAGAYIIGNGANSALDDERTLAERVSSYGKLMRIASVALRSKYAEGKVFVSVDNKWNLKNADEIPSENEADPTAPIAQRAAFGGAEFLSALGKELGGYGFEDYGVALIPNSAEEDSDITNDALATDSSDTEILSYKNLAVAREHIGKETELILYRCEIPSADEAIMARSYAYAYMMATKNGASAFIYNGQWDRATGNGDSGLWKTDSSGIAYEKRQICHTYADIDRVGAAESYLSEELKGAKSFYLTSGGGSTFMDEKNKVLKKAEKVTLFDFSDGKSHDFFPSDSAKNVEISTFVGSNALKSALQPKYDGENVGVRSAPILYESLKNAITVSAVISADPGEGNTALVTLALAQNGDEKSIFHTSSVSIQASNRQTVYFDISDAELDGELGDVTLYLWVRNEGARSQLYDNAEAIEEKEQLLYIESITAHIKKGSGAVVAVIIIIAVIALLALAYFVFFFPGGQKNQSGRVPASMGNRPMGNVRPGGARPMPNGAQRPSVRPHGRPMQQQGSMQRKTQAGQRMQNPQQRTSSPMSGENEWNQNMR